MLEKIQLNRLSRLNNKKKHSCPEKNIFKPSLSGRHGQSCYGSRKSTGSGLFSHREYTVQGNVTETDMEDMKIKNKRDSATGDQKHQPTPLRRPDFMRPCQKHLALLLFLKNAIHFLQGKKKQIAY